MVWQQYVYLIFAILVCVVSISLIGKPREASTPGLALVGVTIQVLLVWMVLSI